MTVIRREGASSVISTKSKLTTGFSRKVLRMSHAKSKSISDLLKNIKESMIVMVRILISKPCSSFEFELFVIEIDTAVSSLFPKLRIEKPSIKNIKPVRPFIAF
jgi:hypothetical protein